MPDNVSTPCKSDDKGKKRELSSPFSDVENKKNKENDDDSDNDTVVSDTSETSDIAQPSPVHLADSDLKEIAKMIKCAINSEVEPIVKSIVEPLVKSIVEGVTKSLSKKIETLETENKTLKSQVKSLNSKVEALELANDNAEQYSRRNCVRIVGIPSSPEENTDDIVLKLASECDVDLSPSDIDRSHRVGKTPTWPRHRAIIVKFATYRARSRFFRGRVNLKDNHTYRNVFVNEDLTASRVKLFEKARKLVKDNQLKQAWTYDGRVYVKTDNDERSVISKPSDLEEFMP